jgi:hypothetical protein
MCQGELEELRNYNELQQNRSFKKFFNEHDINKYMKFDIKPIMKENSRNV